MRPADAPPDPVIILTASRSGSTLLRFILDTHPDLACPPESGIGAVCANIARFCGVLDGTSAKVGPGLGGMSADTEQAMLGLFDATYRRYLGQRGKKRWCDKSLDNVLHADLLAQIWPNAQFICLVRHCMDVIASGVEACAWGLSGFGFDTCASLYPGNSVAAIGSYWAQTMTAMFEFEKDYPERCHRVRYEDLVDDPERAAAGIFDFLGERQVPGITRQCLRAPHEATGPGDEKIWFTSRVSDESVGRGVRVPAEMLPPPLREHINGLLGMLSYQPVTQYWNSATGPIDPRLPDPAADEQDQAATVTVPGSQDPLLERAMALITERARLFSGDRRAEIVRRWPAFAGRDMGIVLTSGAEERVARWHLGPGDGSDALFTATTGGTAPLLAGEAATWQAILAGHVNIAIELRAGRLRWVGEIDRSRFSSAETRIIAEILSLKE